MIRFTLMGALLLLGTRVQDVVAQRATGGVATGGGEVSIIAGVGTKNYTSRVPGTCKHEPTASIYDVPAALWMVQADGSDNSEIKQLSFTLWRPKNGSADQVSISLDVGSGPIAIQVNPREKPVGAATVKLQPIGSGGKFEVRGKDASGTKVNLVISCPVFGGIETAGG